METPTHQYRVTRRDFTDAQLLYRKSRPAFAVWYYFWNWFLPLASLGVLLAAIVTHLFGRPEISAILTPFAWPAAWFALFIPLARWWQMRRAWKVFCASTGSGQQVIFQFDQNEFISSVPDRSRSHIFWSAVYGFAEDDRLALIFLQKKRFLVVPKSALTATEWERLRSFLPSSATRS